MCIPHTGPWEETQAQLCTVYIPDTRPCGNSKRLCIPDTGPWGNSSTIIRIPHTGPWGNSMSDTRPSGNSRTIKHIPGPQGTPEQLNVYHIQCPEGTLSQLFGYIPHIIQSLKELQTIMCIPQYMTLRELHHNYAYTAYRALRELRSQIYIYRGYKALREFQHLDRERVYCCVQRTTLRTRGATRSVISAQRWVPRGNVLVSELSSCASSLAWRQNPRSCGVFKSWISVAHCPFQRKWWVLHIRYISALEQVGMSFNGIAYLMKVYLLFKREFPRVLMTWRTARAGISNVRSPM